MSPGLRLVNRVSWDRCVQSKDHTWKGHNASVDQVGWHSTNADVLASASSDKTLRVWDARTHKPVVSVPTRGENINLRWAPARAPDTQLIAVGNKDDLVPQPAPPLPSPTCPSLHSPTYLPLFLLAHSCRSGLYFTGTRTLQAGRRLFIIDFRNTSFYAFRVEIRL